jgi:hypothetical protein
VSENTVTRRSAIQAGTIAALGLGLAGAAPVLAAPEPAATIDQAEALLLAFEQIAVQLDDDDRVDLSVELNRLDDICKARDPRAAAAELSRNTGGNRSSAVWERGHQLAHNSVMPQYGHLIAAAAAAGKVPGLDWQARQAAEDALAEAYAAAEAADVERYGRVGQHAWTVAYFWARAGRCEECQESA